MDIQRFSKTGFTWNRPHKGRSKKLSPCAVHQVQKLVSKNRRRSSSIISLEVAEAQGQLVSVQTIHHTLQQVLWSNESKAKLFDSDVVQHV